MATFTIDSDNNIAAHAEFPAGADNLQSFSTEKELAKLSAEWSGTRLVEIWNGFAGVAPFDELKPVKKFTNRKAAVARIWQAVTRLSPDAAQPAPDVATTKKNAKKSPANASRRGQAHKGEAESRANKKAEVIVMMKRAKGATLAEIVQVTGWQKHTVRSFVSILGSKGGRKIESSKNAAGSVATTSRSSLAATIALQQRRFRSRPVAAFSLCAAILARRRRPPRRSK